METQVNGRTKKKNGLAALAPDHEAPRKRGRPKKVQEKVELPVMDIKIATFTIVGNQPLICNNFSGRNKAAILDKQTGQARTQKAPRDIQAEYQDSFYKIGRNKYGFPARCLKRAMTECYKYTDGFKKTYLNGAFHVLATHDDLLELKGGKPHMYEAMVRQGGFKGGMVPRFRAMFDTWTLTFKVRYNARAITLTQLYDLLKIAGFANGLGDWRPQRSGSFGTFDLKL